MSDADVEETPEATSREAGAPGRVDLGQSYGHSFRHTCRIGWTRRIAGIQYGEGFGGAVRESNS